MTSTLRKEKTTDTTPEKTALPIPSLTVKLRKYDGNQGESKAELLAFVDLTIGGHFVIRGVRLLEGENGPFVAMPSQKGKDGKWYDIGFPVTKEARQAVQDLVVSEYKKL